MQLLEGQSESTISYLSDGERISFKFHSTYKILTNVGCVFLADPVLEGLSI